MFASRYIRTVLDSTRTQLRIEVRATPPLPLPTSPIHDAIPKWQEKLNQSEAVKTFLEWFQFAVFMVPEWRPDGLGEGVLGGECESGRGNPQEISPLKFD